MMVSSESLFHLRKSYSTLSSFHDRIDISSSVENNPAADNNWSHSLTFKRSVVNITPNSLFKVFEEDVTGSISAQMIFISLYSLIFLLGLTGNALIVHVVVHRPAMHTVFNIFLANLAISDILMCLLAVPFTPISAHHNWIFGETICHMVPMTLGVTVHVSTMTSTAIAVNRYVTIVQPHRPKMRRINCLILILFIWFLSVLISLPLAIYQKIDWEERNDSMWCVEDWPSETSQQFFTVANFILQYLVPCSIIVFCYVNVSLTLAIRARKTIGSGRTNQERIDMEVFRNRRTNRMLIAMVCIFVGCWMPLNIIHFISDYSPEFRQWKYCNDVFLVAHVIAMSSAVYNPFLYAWMNTGFRKEFAEALPCLFRRRDPTTKAQRSVHAPRSGTLIPEPRS